jgi:hypothetical protein
MKRASAAIGLRRKGFLQAVRQLLKAHVRVD